ncbi:hypothetical protein BU101_14390, partial [Staphylococcus shinii]
MLAIYCLLLLLILYNILSFIVIKRNIMIFKIYKIINILKITFIKFNKKYYFILFFINIICVFISKLFSYNIMISFVLVLGIHIFYGISYLSLFPKKKEIRKYTLVEHIYKTHQSITYGFFFYKLLFVVYLLLFLIFCSMIFTFLPYYIIETILTGSYKNSVLMFGTFIYLNVLVLPPVTIKLFLFTKEKRSLIITIVKNLLLIFYGFIIIYTS